MKRFITSIGIVGLGALLACSSAAPPRELVDARAAYQRAAQSPNAQFVPGDMIEAQRALSAAEKKYEDDGDSRSTRDAAYIAHRKALSATAKAETIRAQHDKQMALADLEQFRQQQASQLSQELSRTKSALGEAEERAQSERQARAAADQKAQELLSKIEGLKTERSDKGLVLTLSGSVLFASGKSTLLPAAQRKLKQAAEAIKDDPRPILVVGHADASGPEDKNMKLSEQRAEAVRRFLVQNGVPEDKIRSEGAGETQPIASNDTPEGRANNRRVEIILQDSATGMGQQRMQQDTSKAKTPSSEGIQKQQQPMQEQQKQPMQEQQKQQQMQQQQQPMMPGDQPGP